jgi:hypothetical protein
MVARYGFHALYRDVGVFVLPELLPGRLHQHYARRRASRDAIRPVGKGCCCGGAIGYVSRRPEGVRAQGFTEQPCPQQTNDFRILRRRR